MDDRIVFLRVICKEIGVFHQICRRRFGHFAACIHMGKHLCRADGNAIQIAFLAHQDVHGHQGDVPFAQKFFGQVAGAVRCDLDLHVVSPFHEPFAGPRPAHRNISFLFYHRSFNIVKYSFFHKCKSFMKALPSPVFLYTYHKIAKGFMVLSENSVLPVYFVRQKLYNKMYPNRMDRTGLLCGR